MEKRRRKVDDFQTAKLYDRQVTAPYGNWEWVPFENVPWDEELENEARFALVSGVKVIHAGS